ncbi:MAG: hypothetical protein IK111_03110 [Lachnospiraceae bacterium]|nr:hypothetical protein [Lachnospiraceae bacterium]
MKLKKKLNDIIFILAFLACMIVPAAFINTKTMQVSAIDNKLLTEWPGLDISLKTNTIVEDYLNDRIGFREQAIELYTELNDKLFHVMVHPLFMYGKDGQIFYKESTYIKGYQHMNTDEAYLDTFVDFLKETDDYLKSKDIKFLYFLCPDKKTIYPEYFPDSIHVNTANPGITDYMDSKLKDTGIDYIIPVDELKEAKKDQVVYNKLYDATHWNEDGAFLGHQLIDQKIQETFDDVRPLVKEDYDRTMEHMDTLDVAKFTIDEDVPHYALKYDNGSDMTGYMYETAAFADNSFYCHFSNPDCGNNRRLLIFCDSYFGNYHKFYQNRFCEVYFVHWHNYKYLQYYVNLFFPDMIIYETAERSITGEMIGGLDEDGNRISTIGYDNVYYEPPYLKTAKVDAQAAATMAGMYNGIVMDASDRVKYSFTIVTGVDRDGTTLYLQPDGGPSVVSINGYIESLDGGDYDVYANVGGEQWVECDYYELHGNGEPSETKEFQVNVQRRYLFEETITLVAVDTKTGIPYLLDDLEVKYAE